MIKFVHKACAIELTMYSLTLYSQCNFFLVMSTKKKSSTKKYFYDHVNLNFTLEKKPHIFLKQEGNYQDYK